MAWTWKAARKQDGEEKSSELKTPSELDAAFDPEEEAIETVGVFLRTMGQYAFDLQEEDADVISERFELWQRHLLMGTARPGFEPERQPRSLEQRDWPGARQFFTHHRRAEQRYVNASIGDMQRVIWALIHGLNRAVAQDDVADNGVRKELERLESTAQTGSLEEIKREVLIAVARIGAVIDERLKEQEENIKKLGQQLENLGNQLREAQAENALDPLTRLNNRKAFDDYLAQTLELFSLFHHPACLLLIDVDHFKQINDKFGHSAGDVVLQGLAARFGRTFMMKGDFVARFGGEEFAVVLRYTDKEAGRLLCERLMSDVRALRVPYDTHQFQLTVSIGCAPVMPGDTSQSWIDRADRALYEAKRAGRDRIVIAGLRAAA